MASLLEKMFESIESDLKDLITVSKSCDENKVIRKECSLLLKRLESAKKVSGDNSFLLNRISSLENQISQLKQKC
jgi:hypothetical protein